MNRVKHSPRALKKSIHNADYLELIAALRTARESAGLSQSELAQKLGRPQSFVSKIEGGERRLDLIEALELCTALEISLAKLIPSRFRRLLR